MIVRRTKKFSKNLKKYTKNNQRRANEVINTIKKLYLSPLPNSLNLEKLIGSEFWSIRINKGDRIFLKLLSKSELILVDIGPHDKYRKLKTFNQT